MIAQIGAGIARLLGSAPDPSRLSQGFLAGQDLMMSRQQQAMQQEQARQQMSLAQAAQELEQQQLAQQQQQFQQELGRRDRSLGLQEQRIEGQQDIREQLQQLREQRLDEEQRQFDQEFQLESSRVESEVDLNQVREQLLNAQVGVREQESIAQRLENDLMRLEFENQEEAQVARDEINQTIENLPEDANMMDIGLALSRAGAEHGLSNAQQIGAEMYQTGIMELKAMRSGYGGTGSATGGGGGDSDADFMDQAENVGALLQTLGIRPRARFLRQGEDGFGRFTGDISFSEDSDVNEDAIQQQLSGPRQRDDTFRLPNQVENVMWTRIAQGGIRSEEGQLVRMSPEQIALSTLQQFEVMGEDGTIDEQGIEQQQSQQSQLVEDTVGQALDRQRELGRPLTADEVASQLSSLKVNQLDSQYVLNHPATRTLLEGRDQQFLQDVMTKLDQVETGGEGADQENLGSSTSVEPGPSRTSESGLPEPGAGTASGQQFQQQVGPQQRINQRYSELLSQVRAGEMSMEEAQRRYEEFVAQERGVDVPPPASVQ